MSLMIDLEFIFVFIGCNVVVSIGNDDVEGGDEETAVVLVAFEVLLLSWLVSLLVL